MTGIDRASFREEDGQDLIEYALLAALALVTCITGILELTRITSGSWLSLRTAHDTELQRLDMELFGERKEGRAEGASCPSHIVRRRL